MLNLKEQKEILQYRDYSLLDLLQENLSQELPATVKIAAYVSSSDTSFLKLLGENVTSELNSEPPFIRAFFIDNMKGNNLPSIHFKELLKLVYHFPFTKESIKKAITCIVLETQYKPYSFLSEILKYDIPFILSKIKSDIDCEKFKERIFNEAKNNNHLSLLFSNPFFYLDSYELQAFAVPESYVISYIQNMKCPRSEVDRVGFDSIIKKILHL